ncbi:MAG: DUF4397 domain-containing protein [Candidatus Nanopelagicales bacterium]
MRRTASPVRMGVTFGFAGILAAGSIGVASQTADATQRSKTATVTVLHAIPTDVGAVDVYADGRKIAANLAPGQLRTMQIPAGKYDFLIVPAGVASNPSTALLEMTDARLSAGADMTVAAHLDERGRPDLTAFTNKTRTVGQGMGRLTMRHLAVAPAIQVRSKGSVMFDRLENGDEADVGLRAGTYPVRISGLESESPAVVRTSAKIRNAPGRSDMGNNVIVYVWGSSSDGQMRTTIQEVQLDLT